MPSISVDKSSPTATPSAMATSVETASPTVLFPTDKVRLHYSTQLTLSVVFSVKRLDFTRFFKSKNNYFHFKFDIQSYLHHLQTAVDTCQCVLNNIYGQIT
jgi:hypothetical protein